MVRRARLYGGYRYAEFSHLDKLGELQYCKGFYILDEFRIFSDAMITYLKILN